MGTEIYNAVISSASVSNERGGLCYSILFEFNASEEGFCSESMGIGWFLFDKEGIAKLDNIMNLVGVHLMENLKGKPVRIKIEGRTIITHIGHYLKNEWVQVNSNSKSKGVNS